jgi:chromosome segregation ATPase
LSACSVLQGKLEKAEARLKVHKSHEEALAKQCDSLSASLSAHRSGEKKAVQNAAVMKREMTACIEEQKEKARDYAARYRQLDQEHQLLDQEHQTLQKKYISTKQRVEQLDER